MQHNTTYTILFASAVCVVCSIFVSTSAVSLKEMQEENAKLDRQKKVLSVAGLMDAGAGWTAEKVEEAFTANIRAKVVDLKTGDYNEAIDATTFDQLKASKDPAQSRVAPKNDAQVQRLPNQALVYHVLKEGAVDMLVFPVEGKGLWSTLYGFLALDKDGNTIRGLTFYHHGETPGLGGEVDNPKWKSLWPGRKAFDENRVPKIQVIKGQAPKADVAPYEVDGLSGATITSRGVTHLLHFWLGESGFRPYLNRFMERGN